MSVKTVITRLTAHPDKLTETGNFIALVLAWNAPFYPLYVWFIAGSASLPSSLMTAFSLPVFACVPWLARRSGRAGRVLVCLAGTGNVVWCNWVLGEAAGVSLFLLPCIMLASLLFRPAEWRIGTPLVALPILCGWFLPAHLRAPPHVYSASEYTHLLNMNAGSVALLIAFLGYNFARALHDDTQ